MHIVGNAAHGAARKKCVRNNIGSAVKSFNARGRMLATAFFLPLLLATTSAQAGLRQPSNVPLKQFGFATIGRADTKDELIRFYDATQRVLGTGAIVRTGLGWDPTRRSTPNFAVWSDEVLEPALARGITVLPAIKTMNLDGWGYRMPTDEQWTTGLRMIVRMYGPNGFYATGGSYEAEGRTVRVKAHPGYAGLTDFELWNEPNSKGDIHDTMTPAKMVHLLKIGSAAMREEASRLGFEVNIIGPAIGGIDLGYLTELWMADNNVFSYIDTLSIHAYTRYSPSQCDAFGVKKRRCVRTFDEIRKFMDSHGGEHVHLGTTEGGMAGDQGACLGPQVQTEEEQRDYLEANLSWLRSKPELNFDFWITSSPIDRKVSYGYSCDSRKFDIRYWEHKLGVIRPDNTLKLWGARYRELYKLWNQ